MTIEQQKQQFEQKERNNEKLNACRDHHFKKISNDPGSSYRCSNCGGELGQSEINWLMLIGKAIHDKR